ncbi:MAG: MEKHLA domain-containing protein [Gammaproteobacteria bacterium]
MPMDFPAEANNFQAGHARLIHGSYRRLFGRELIPGAASDSEFARLLFHAPFAVLSHDAAADPVFNYANHKGLELFELTWEELCALPSRLSAELPDQAERERLLAEVKNKGCIDDYHGIRITQTGKRFSIHHAEVWNLYDEENRYRGQAACIRQWRFL